MSLKATIEFFLNIESFRNVDLFNQGLYRLQFTIYHEIDNEKRKAVPYNIIDNYNPAKHKSISVFHQSEINEGSSYLTKTFMIRFCEETFDINEICQFRTEIDAYPTLNESNLYYECDLMFFDTVNSIKKYNLPEEVPEFSLFKVVSSFKSKVNNVHTGISEYVPIVFDEEHYCLVNSTFHTLLFDFQFRTSPIEKKAIQTVNLENLDSKPSENQNESQIQVKSYQIPPKNFTELIERITGFKNEEANRFYNLYIRTLKSAYENVGKHMNEFLDYLSTQKKTKNLQPFLAQPILLPLPIPQFLLNSEGFDNKKEENALEESKNSDMDTSKSSSNSELGSANNKLKNNIIKISEKFQLKEKADQEKLSTAILTEINQISYFMFTIWYKFLDLLKLESRGISQNLKETYNIKIKERWGESIFRDKIKTSDLTAFHEPKTGENHKNMAKSLRKKYYYRNLESLNIEDLNMFPKAEIHPIIFDEVYLLEKIQQNLANNINNMNTSQTKKQKKSIESNKFAPNSIHFFIFAHGFQGNSFDMRLFKNTLSILYPDHFFLSSTSNEDNTEQDISELGKNLANEVKQFISEWAPKNEPKRLTFIGHSLGGVIIRAALPHLVELQDCMYTFLTLSTPHMGYIYNTSTLIDAGMWILKRWKKSISLQQLSLSDEKSMKDSFMYKLSEQKGLNWFKNIVLVGSYQDAYAPFESARIQQCKKSINDPVKGALYQKMLDNILGNLKTDRIHRIDVNFNINKKNLDNFIGRAAHIQFLESQALVKMLVYTFDDFFK